jgi:hypothetical protein
VQEGIMFPVVLIAFYAFSFFFGFVFGFRFQRGLKRKPMALIKRLRTAVMHSLPFCDFVL